MLQRGTQPTAPSRQVHWYLQLLWKDSPLLYTVPPKTQGAPSLAEEEEGKKGGCRGQAFVLGPLTVGAKGMRVGSRAPGGELQKAKERTQLQQLIGVFPGGKVGVREVSDHKVSPTPWQAVAVEAARGKGPGSGQ